MWTSWVSLSLLLVLICVDVIATAHPHPHPHHHNQHVHQSRHQNLVVSKDYDCAIRELALDYAQYLQPTLGSYRSIFDALELQTICGQTPPSHVETLQDRMEHVKSSVTLEQLAANPSIYVSPSGSDSNSGTITSPLQTLHGAMALSRQQRNDETINIVLRGGTYELQKTIVLNAVDSKLVITSYPGELVTISGGRTLTQLKWQSFNGSNNIMTTQLPKDAVMDRDHLNQMWLENGKRQIRARFPNADPEVTGLHTTPTGYVSSAAGWVPPKTYPAAMEVHVSDPSRDGFFPQYQMGIGGPVSQFTPPKSFWGLKNPPGGGGSTYLIPSGVIYNISTFSPHVNEWSRPETGLIHAFHRGHWGNWMFTIDSVDVSQDTIYFGRGGIQEARGAEIGSEFYVENILEELDSPGEWYVDDQTGTLYYYVNTTDHVPPSTITISQIPYLFSIQGNSEYPVHHIQFTGLTFAYTSQTFMKEYMVPSGGDWSIHLGAAIMSHGVENIKIDHNLFHGMGGNTILFHGYSRNATVSYNEIVLPGDSGIALIGEFQGIDATDGNQPWDTLISYNLIHEIGIWGKQVSPVIQAVTGRTTILGNILFNMPRAGINFNDGFGGGSLVKNNLIFNTVRETADHGPFNSWDRLPLLWNNSGDITLTPERNRILQNFLINNYHAVWPIDHDDGSCYYTDTYNFMAYGGFKNYLGHSRTVTNNIYLFPDSKRSSRLSIPHPIFTSSSHHHHPHHHQLDETEIHPLDMNHVYPHMTDQWGDYFIEPFCAQSSQARIHESGYNDVWQNNTCTLSVSNVIYSWDDTYVDPKTGLTDLVPKSNYNTFHLDPTTPPVINIRGTGMSLPQYQSAPINYDQQSSILGLIAPQDVTNWGKALLFHEIHEEKH